MGSGSKALKKTVLSLLAQKEISQLAEIKRSVQARKIQKVFRTYRHTKRLHLLARAINQAVQKIQHAYRRYCVRQGLKWRKHVKILLMSTVQAWRTRRALNCLGAEVQQFVNCEVRSRKNRLRQEFHLLFDKVMSDMLYLEKNSNLLKRLQAMHQNMSQSSLVQSNSASSSVRNSLTQIPVYSPKKSQQPLAAKNTNSAKKQQLQFVADDSPLKPMNTAQSLQHLQSKYETHRIPIVSMASAGSLNNSTIYHSIDILNDSLKPREIARTALIPQT